MRRSDRIINATLKNEIIKTFAQTVADLKNTNEAEEFLSDFFTEAEIEAFAKRLAVSYWLKKGRSYTNIRDNIKVSSATIASVQEMMKKKGFKLAIKKMEAEEWANVWSEKIRKFVK